MRKMFQNLRKLEKVKKDLEISYILNSNTYRDARQLGNSGSQSSNP